jgi:hypothetical protein
VGYKYKGEKKMTLSLKKTGCSSVGTTLFSQRKTEKSTNCIPNSLDAE